MYECIRMFYGARRPCDEYDDGRELCAPCKTRVRVGALRSAITDEGANPEYHQRMMLDHRREWPVLWRAIDDLLRD